MIKDITKNAELSAEKTGIEIPIVFTPAEVSRQTGYSKTTIQRAMNSGLLPFIRLTKGGERRIPLKGLRAWLNGETQPDHKDINADHSLSVREIMDRMGLSAALGITNPQPNTERKIENEKE